VSSLRCSICGINYPESLDPAMCPLCEGGLSWFEELDPTPDWQEIVGTAMLERLEPEQRSYLVAVHRLEPPAPPWEFVSHDDLLTSGYKNLSDFDLVVINGRVYELQGYLDKANVWWVEPANVEVPDGPPDEA
jgi:hypothetical protein